MNQPQKYEKGKDPDYVSQKPGAPTARFTKLIKVPVKLLMTLPGLRGEHQVLHPKMEKVKCFIPLVQDLKWQREHPIEIEVHHNGAMCIGDGNHRKLAASLAHLDSYLCKVTFYGGSEDEVNFDTIMAKFASLVKIAEDFWPKNTGEDPNDASTLAIFPKKDSTKPEQSPTKPTVIPKQILNPQDTIDKQILFTQPTKLQHFLQPDSKSYDGMHPRITDLESYYQGRRVDDKYYGEPNPSGYFNRDPDRDVNHFSSRTEFKALVTLARKLIQNGGDLTIVTNTLNKLAEQEIGGNVDNFGSPGDQGYDNMREYGEDLEGENSPDLGRQRRTGPRRNLDNAMVQEAINESVHRIQQIAAEPQLEPFDLSMHPEHMDAGGTKPKPAMPPTVKIREDIDEETGKEEPTEFQYSRTLNPMAPTHQQVHKYELETPEAPSRNKEFTTPRVVHDDFGIGADRYRGPNIPINLMNSKKESTEPKLASSNKPCAKCGMPTDQCVCMTSQQPTQGKNPVKTKGATMSGPMKPKEPKKPSNPKMAAIDLTDAIVALGQMEKYASHLEEVEIPLKDLKLENDVDYGARKQEVNMLITRYLNANVYKKPVHFTIADVVQEGNKIYVKCLVFDNQIDHVEAASVTKANTLHKVSNVTPKNNLEKTAWKKRLVEILGDNDETGLVKCPLEGGFLTRSCAVCPLAGNPKTYIQDGYTECHFDDMTSWLGGNSVKEHHKDTITGM